MWYPRHNPGPLPSGQHSQAHSTRRPKVAERRFQGKSPRSGSLPRPGGFWPSWKAPSSPIQRVVSPNPNPDRVAGPIGMSFDACPWGRGAARTYNGFPTAWAAGIWEPNLLNRFSATVGDSGVQTLLECVASLITLEMWAPSEDPFIVHGDNVGALTLISKLKGRGDCIAVAREVAWRQAARRWRPIPTHTSRPN